MRKNKFTPEQKLKIVQEFLEGKGSLKTLGRIYEIDRSTIAQWVRSYQEHREEAFFPQEGNNRYSAEFKIKCVEIYLRGEMSQTEICVKYGISNHSVLHRWIKKYNGGKELRDYDPRREVYMAPRRKTTKEERIEIVNHCLSHGKDYKNTAALYEVSYSQVYDWVRKFEDSGEEGLEDKRGKRRKDDEVDETEKLRRENVRLKRELDLEKMKVELLKKVKELERKWD